MPRIGVVGSIPLVERVLSVWGTMKHNLEFIPLYYAEFTEVEDIIAANEHRIDGWLFAGPSPYMAARERLQPGAIAVHCQSFGTGFYRAILDLSQQLEHLAGRVSIDIPQDMDVEEGIEEALRELRIPTGEMYIKTYGKNFSAEEYIGFHRDLFRDGISEGAVTSLYSIYLALQKENIPVACNTITKAEAKQAIRILVEKVEAAYFKNTQVGVENIDVGIITEKFVDPYQLQETELDIKRVLIWLSKKLDGYLVENGSGRYEIFSSRGAVERELKSLEQAIEEIAVFIGAPVSVGIGFGESVRAAEINAFRAVNYAKAKRCGVVMVQDDGAMIEEPGKDQELQYPYLSQDKTLLSRLKAAGVSVKIYHKIVAVLRRTGWSGFTAAQLAEQLSVTPRNVNRVMTGLVAAGLAECVGQEAVTEKGRPSKIFRLVD